MQNQTLESLCKIIESGMYAGFAAFAHYLYMYQKGNIAFKFSSLLIAVILGVFCGNLVDAIVPEGFAYSVLGLEISKTAISFIAGFTYKFLLDSIEKYQGIAVKAAIASSKKIKK